MKKFSQFIARHNKFVLLLGVILLLPAVFGYINTRINYDILSYLPEELDSNKGEKILDEVYSDAATGILVIDGMEKRDIVKVKDKIKIIDGIESVVWIDDALDITIPVEILPEKIKNQIYNKDSTLMIIKFSGSTASEETMNAVDKIKSILNKQCFLSGMSAIVTDVKNLANKETPLYIIISVVLAVIILLFSMESIVAPIVFLLSIGMGILYNLGTNIFLGEISYITKALAAVLQLGVTMDYSIFLMHRYDEEKQKHNSNKEAMTEAIQATMLSISASSLTTVAGFLALCAMNLTLGRDIGVVMAKGVIIGVICSVTILPSFILAFDKLIHRWSHKVLIPEFSRLSNFIPKHYKVIIALFLVTLIPAFYGNQNVKVYYNLDATLPADTDSIVATNKLKDKFKMTTTHFIIIREDIESYKVKEMISKLKEVQGVTSIIGYDEFIGPVIPEDFVPDKIRDIFKQGGYNIILANSAYKSAEDEENKQINELNSIVKEYDKDGLITGEGVLTKDLIDVADVDFKNVSAASIIAIFIIITIAFKSISIPVILVSSIEYAIFINMGIPYYTGSIIPFIASIVIGTIQLGATVDYAILMTSRFQEEIQKGYEKKESIIKAMKGSFRSIVTSALTFFSATGAVAIVSNMSLIKSLCFLIARGALISMVVIIFVLPSLLLVSEGIIRKTTKGWDKTI